VVAFDPIIKKFVVLDCAGTEHGFRRCIEDARAFAVTLPGSPWVPPEPAPLSRSPRATGCWGGQRAEYQPPGPQPDELPIPTKPQPRVVRVRPR
jgi:hypothetical protein